MTDEASHHWRPITDLSGDPDRLGRAELRQLSAVWDEQRETLEDAEGMRRFEQRLRRAWAIETGLLERIYSLDRGVTEMLIERGIDAALIPHSGTDRDPQEVVAVLRDHESAIDSLFDFVKGGRQLSTSYVKELHALLTRNQPTTSAIDGLGRRVDVELLRGDYKRVPNNPRRSDGTIHEYCPPEHVAAEMDRLIAMHSAHGAAPPEVEAAWLHHRFTQIHPFQDGNGRVARCLASLVFLRAGWFPLVVRDLPDERVAYIDALEQADSGALEPLVGLFAGLQKKALVQAIGVSTQVLEAQKIRELIRATRNRLEARRQVQREDWQRAKDIAGSFVSVARERLSSVAEELREEMGELLSESRFFADHEPFDGDRGHYFRWQIAETAKALGYFANPNDLHAWVRLVLRAGSQTEILVSFHVPGHEFRGVLAASACFFRREESGEGSSEARDVIVLTSELFQVNYHDDDRLAEQRFRDWLEGALLRGLDLWRRSV